MKTKISELIAIIGAVAIFVVTAFTVFESKVDAQNKKKDILDRIEIFHKDVCQRFNRLEKQLDLHMRRDK